MELWHPERGTWAPGPPLAMPRAGHQLVEVERGTFLVVGATRDAAEALSTTWEVWRPGAGG